MKTFLFTLFLTLSGLSYADQLAYNSKEVAEEATALISKLKYVYLFCGCCTLVEPKKVEVVGVYFKHTGYENYYEVYLQYSDDSGEVKETPLDLAYVWTKKLFGFKTIGQLLSLEHDPCVKLKNWDNPKYVEKDI